MCCTDRTRWPWVPTPAVKTGDRAAGRAVAVVPGDVEHRDVVVGAAGQPAHDQPLDHRAAGFEQQLGWSTGKVHATCVRQFGS